MNRHRARLTRPGFTLVELLTVIGIIILLIGILLPVLSSIRKSAWATDSQAALTNLASAIERYRQDFSAYPGPIANVNFNTPNGQATTFSGGAPSAGMTMTENLSIAMLGGWEPGATPPSTSSFSAAQVGNGPMSHNPLATARKRYQPYFDANFGATVQPYTSGTTWALTAMTASENQYASADRSDIPEFIDKFPDPMPVIYLRARSGAPSFVAGTATTPTPRIDDTTQYNPAHLLPYIQPDAGGTTRSPFPGNTRFPGSSEDLNSNGTLDSGEDANGSGTLDRDWANVGKYFQNPGVQTEVRQKDGFWLIGAGPDRKYGTKDDQTNFGPIQ